MSPSDPDLFVSGVRKCYAMCYGSMLTVIKDGVREEFRPREM
jgi:hypothetical protein